jgi:hypothetical protein
MLNITKSNAVMKTSQDIGRNFEKNIHSYLESTKLVVHREKDVKSLFGKNNSAIDHMIVTDTFIICFQDKWMVSKPTISNINHFIQCVNNVSKIASKNCYGIYLSNLPLTDDANKAFIAENSINNSLNFISIVDNNEDMIVQKLFYFLYSIGIFSYDDDNSCRMLE